MKLFVSLSLEDDFVSWREQFWPAVCEHFGVEALGDELRFVHILIFFYFLAFEFIIYELFFLVTPMLVQITLIAFSPLFLILSRLIRLIIKS